MSVCKIQGGRTEGNTITIKIDKYHDQDCDHHDNHPDHHLAHGGDHHDVDHENHEDDDRGK